MVRGLDLTPGFGEGTEWTDGFSGAGMVDTVAGLTKAVHDKNNGAIAAFSVGLGFDVVGAALNPLGAVIGAGVGWLIDHIFFLREPLDLLMGDNIAIRQETAKIAEEAKKYDEFATIHVAALKKLDGWAGEAADKFRQMMLQVGKELEALGGALEAAGKIMGTMGACVTATRSLVRDIIAMVIGNLIGGALTAAGLAPFTFGASIVAFIGVAVATATQAVGRIMSHITKLKGFLTGAAKSTDDLGEALAKMGGTASAFGKGGVPTNVPTPPAVRSPGPGTTSTSGVQPPPLNTNVPKPPQDVPLPPSPTGGPRPQDVPLPPSPTGGPRPQDVPSPTAGPKPPPGPGTTSTSGVQPPPINTNVPKPPQDVPLPPSPTGGPRPQDVPLPPSPTAGPKPPPGPGTTSTSGVQPPPINTNVPKPPQNVPLPPSPTGGPKPQDVPLPPSPTAGPKPPPAGTGPAAPKPPDPNAPPAGGPGQNPPATNVPPAAGPGQKPPFSWAEVKNHADDLAKYSKEHLDSVLVTKFGKTPEEAAETSKWIKNFEELAAPGGQFRWKDAAFQTGTGMHLLHELWKELEGDGPARTAQGYMGDLKEYNAR
ncbi:hypothetical protein ACIA8G_09275 [Lentzea sp. NPDC051213]|uniref:hypothetical protein n=1 Tax=Lentzea sp. NPDC051213 TaxID=3364126 RepID=UPI0037A45B43